MKTRIYTDNLVSPSLCEKLKNLGIIFPDSSNKYTMDYSIKWLESRHGYLLIWNYPIIKVAAEAYSIYDSIFCEVIPCDKALSDFSMIGTKLTKYNTNKVLYLKDITEALSAYLDHYIIEFKEFPDMSVVSVYDVDEPETMYNAYTVQDALCLMLINKIKSNHVD